jgi:hypothetical protein
MSKNRAGLSVLIPAVVAAGLVADVSLRFLDVGRFSFRAWNAAARYYTPDSPFTRNMRYENPSAYGDLASLSNLPEYRQYRREVFTTDEAGFRNLKREPPYDAVLLGDSFAVGSGVNDDETLSAQLQTLTGLKTYNGGHMKRDLTRILRLTSELEMTKGVVIYEFLSRYELPPREDANQPRPDPDTPWQTIRRKFKEMKYLWIGFWSVSPVEILLQRAFKRLQNGRWLPNPWAEKVLIKTPRGGSPSLFLAEAVPGPEPAGPLDLDVFVRYERALRARGLRFVVLLVPDKYPVYRGLIPGEAPSGVPFYLDRIETGLIKEGVPVINLTRAMRHRAAEELEQGRDLFWRDDTHWNPLGTRVAAEAAAEAVKALARERD